MARIVFTPFDIVNHDDADHDDKSGESNGHHANGNAKYENGVNNHNNV